MKFAPMKRHETPDYAVATAAQPKKANGRVVIRGGVKYILKHEAYSKRPLSAPVLTYRLPTEGYR